MGETEKAGMAPGSLPPGATSATHGAKKRHVLFGGVVDHEIRKGEVIISEFFNDAYSMSLDNGRWYPGLLTPTRAPSRRRRERRLDARRPNAWRAARFSTRTFQRARRHGARGDQDPGALPRVRGAKGDRLYRIGGQVLGAAVLPGVRRGRPGRRRPGRAGA